MWGEDVLDLNCGRNWGLKKGVFIILWFAMFPSYDLLLKPRKNTKQPFLSGICVGGAFFLPT